MEGKRQVMKDKGMQNISKHTNVSKEIFFPQAAVVEDLADDMVKDVTNLYTKGKQTAETYLIDAENLLVDFARSRVAPLVHRNLRLDPNTRFDSDTFEIFEVKSGVSEGCTSCSYMTHILIPNANKKNEKENVHLAFDDGFVYSFETEKTCETVGIDGRSDCHYSSEYTNSNASASSNSRSSIEESDRLLRDSFSTISTVGTTTTNDTNSFISRDDKESQNKLVSIDEVRIMTNDGCSTTSIMTPNTFDKYRFLKKGETRSESEDEVEVVSRKLRIIRKRRNTLPVISEENSHLETQSTTSSTKDRYIHAFKQSDFKSISWNVVTSVASEGGVELSSISLEEDDGEDSLYDNTLGDSVKSQTIDDIGCDKYRKESNHEEDSLRSKSVSCNFRCYSESAVDDIHRTELLNPQYV